MRNAIRNVGARLVFLPKYSPDLNPIEQVFAKFKTLLRKAGARTYEAISDACGKIPRPVPARRMRRIPQGRIPQERRIDAGTVTDLDYSAARTVRDLLGELTAKNVGVAFARVSAYLRADLDRHGISAKVGESADLRDASRGSRRGACRRVSGWSGCVENACRVVGPPHQAGNASTDVPGGSLPPASARKARVSARHGSQTSIHQVLRKAMPPARRNGASQ